MAQDYVLTAFNPSDFQDPHGNTWCDAAFQGVSEPVKIVVKDPTQYKEGQTLYGEITDATSKAGKSYLRFKRQQKPEQAGSSEPSTKKEWQPRDDDGIKAQFAIKTAMSYYAGSGKTYDKDGLETLAKELYSMVDRVKGTDPVKETFGKDVVYTGVPNDMPADFLQ